LQFCVQQQLLTVQFCVQQQLLTVQFCVQQQLITMQFCVQQSYLLCNAVSNSAATFKGRPSSIPYRLAASPFCCCQPFEVIPNDTSLCTASLSVQEVLQTVITVSVCRFTSLLAHHQTECPLHSQYETDGPLFQ